MQRRRRLRTFVGASGASLVGLIAASSHAVIIATGEGRNLQPPPEPYLDAWNLQGWFGLFLATPIDSRHILTAAHATATAQPFTFRGHTYTMQPTPTNVPGTDLRIWTLDTTNDPTLIPAAAQLWDDAVDGSEIGRDFVVFGRGIPRTTAIYAPINPGPTIGPVVKTVTANETILSYTGSVGTKAVPANVQAVSTGQSSLAGPVTVVSDELRGWHTGPFDGQTSWGRNVVDDVLNFDKPDTPIKDRIGDLLAFDLDRPDQPGAIDNEGGLVNFDSGGGVFIRSGGVWKLAGINYTADLSYATTPEGLYDDSWDDGYARNVLVDVRGLYTLIADGPDEGTDYDIARIGYDDSVISTLNLSSRVGASRSFILSAIGSTGSFEGGSSVAVPEPSSLAIVAGLGLAMRRRRVR